SVDGGWLRRRITPYPPRSLARPAPPCFLCPFHHPPRRRPMPTPVPHEITQLLDQARAGDAHALDRLLPLVYAELRALARRQRLRQGAAETLNTTALVHEAYEKLARSGSEGGAWNDRTHFFRVAAKAMRQVLVDYARRCRAETRGGVGQ